MANGKPPASAYRSAVRAVRGVLQEMDAEALRTIARSVNALGEGLEEAISSLDAGEDARRQTLEASREVVQQQYESLLRELGPAIEEGRTTSYERILEIWEETAAQVAEQAGALDEVVGAIRASPINTLGVYDGIGGAQNWRTLLRGHVESAASEADRIVRLTFSEGVGPDELSRRLRRYVEGSEAFDELFEEVPTLTGDVAKIDLRKVPADVRKSAGQMRFNARRIAFTENQMARGEAEVQHYLSDPLIEAIRRTLSPNRGVSFSGPDECDVLAQQDIYGLGPGVYPIGKAPPLAVHPFDRCEHRTVTREPSRMDEDKPVPDRRMSGSDVSVPGSSELTANRIERIRENTERSLEAGEEAWQRIQERAA